VPSAVFGRPPIGTVGLAESDARRSHGDSTSTHQLPADAHMLSATRTYADEAGRRPEDRPVLGVHIAGEDAPEMVQLAAVP